MEREYKRDLQNNYLILKAPETKEEEGYALQMLLQNEVKGLLQISAANRDGVRYLHYEITSKQTLESLFEKKPMEYQDILMVLTGIRDAAEDMRRYLLSAKNLLFAPDLIYVLPEGGGVRLCYYIGEQDCPISLLAEFILKKLNHRDPAAVALGYGLYDKVSMENFSLDSALKELLFASGEKGQEQEFIFPEDLSGSEGACGAKGNGRREPSARAESASGPDDPDPPQEGTDTRGIHVEHHERRKKKKGRFSEKIFSVVHPAVLLSVLLLVIALEVALIEDLLSLTEAGGLFFLLLAAELLINRGLQSRKKKEKPLWSEEESDEEYEDLLEEMYEPETSPPLTTGLQRDEDNPKRGAQGRTADPIGETVCLLEEEDAGALRLVHLPERPQDQRYPDICPGENPLFVGKKSGEADIILPVATVSRMHARIQKRGDACYVQDMNSKNGTFLNGERLPAQEEAEIHKEDVVAFAKVRFRAE